MVGLVGVGDALQTPVGQQDEVQAAGAVVAAVCLGAGASERPGVGAGECVGAGERVGAAVAAVAARGVDLAGSVVFVLRHSYKRVRKMFRSDRQIRFLSLKQVTNFFG